MKAYGIGRLTRDPSITITTTGKKVARFTLACGRIGQNDTADYISCVAWEKTADLLEKYTHKGSKLFVEGNIQTGAYDDPNIMGRKVYTTDVVVSQVTFLDTKAKEEKEEAPEFIDVNDDLPF